MRSKLFNMSGETVSNPSAMFATSVVALLPGPPGLIKRLPILSAVLFVVLGSLTMPKSKVLLVSGACQSIGTDKFAHCRLGGSQGSVTVQLLHEMLLFDARVERGIESAGTVVTAMDKRRPAVYESGEIMMVKQVPGAVYFAQLSRPVNSETAKF